MVETEVKKKTAFKINGKEVSRGEFIKSKRQEKKVLILLIFWRLKKKRVLKIYYSLFCYFVTGLGYGLTGYFHAIMTTGEFGYKRFSLFGTSPVGLKHKVICTRLNHDLYRLILRRSQT